MTRTPIDRIEAADGTVEFQTAAFVQPIVVLLDQGGRILYVNEAWSAFCLGHDDDPDPNVWNGRDFLEITQSAQVEEGGEGLLLSAALRDLVSGKRESFEITYACRRGSRPRWFKMMCRAVSNSPAVRAVVMLIDVTESFLGEMSVRETEKRLCSLFEEGEADLGRRDLSGRAIEAALSAAGVPASEIARGNGNGRVRLSPRERECLRWTSHGLRSKEVADKLGITTKTVEHHLAKAKQKLDSKNRVEAVTRAIALNLIYP